MKWPLTFAFLLPTLFSPANAEARYFPQIGNGTNGNLGFSTSIELVNTGTPAEIQVSCFDNDGNPLYLEWSGTGSFSSSSFQIALSKGEVTQISSSGTGALRSGYVILEAPERVSGTVVLTGLDTATGEVLYEAGVPAVYPARELSILLDSFGDSDSGLALVAARDSQDNPTTLNLYLRDASGEQLGKGVIELGAGEKEARFVFEFFQDDLFTMAQELRGSLSIVSNGLPVAAVTLRMSGLSAGGNPLLTAFPVVPFAVDPEETVDERVLVFAPHPDDEVLGCAGALRRATDRGDATLVVFATCGDAYLSAKQLFQGGFPALATDQDGDGDFDMLDYGVIRCAESISAAEELGLNENNLLFLGYPDAGLDDLWRSPEVFRSPFTEVSAVPQSYPFAYRTDATYRRESILQDIKSIIREFGPTHIYAPTVTDHHQDHWALSKFVTQALIELSSFRTWEKQIGYLIHWEANSEEWPGDTPNWKPPTGHAPPDIGIQLSDFGFSAGEKEIAIRRYFSQILASEDYLLGFAKQDEIFWLESFGAKE